MPLHLTTLPFPTRSTVRFDLYSVEAFQWILKISIDVFERIF